MIKKFLIKVNPGDWIWGKKEPHNWDDIKDRAEVSFDGNCERKSDIQKLRLNDIFIGYNMDSKESEKRNKVIVCLGRIISDGCFRSLGMIEKGENKRFLVQKIITLDEPIEREWLEKNISLGINQHTVTELREKDWQVIKNEIFSNESGHKEIIEILEKGSNDLWL